MNQEILNILLSKLETKWVSVTIKPFSSIIDLPIQLARNAGIYQIKTDAPISILKKFGERNDKAHYNFSKKIEESLKLKDLFIKENLLEGYVVYTGHQKHLRQRCKEHFIGSRGTGCLNIFEFEELKKYNWWFEYLEVSNFSGFTDSQLGRTYLEQLHRANIGWPILCSQ